MSSEAVDSSTIDTSSIKYNYDIAKALFDNTKIIKRIDKEVTKLIESQIDLLLAASNETDDKQKLDFIKDVFFKDAITEHGQIGSTPLIYIDGKKKTIQTIAELKLFVKSLNIREKMTMLKNFISKNNDCIMYSIIIEYNTAVKQQQVETFTTRYPMLNTDILDHTINTIENVLGFEIEETEKCYTDIKGTQLVPCTRKTKPYYKLIQDHYKSINPKSPITICWLWHPLIYGVPYQDVIKLESNNLVKEIATSYKEVTDESKRQKCLEDTFRMYPAFPTLSERERSFMLTKGIEPNIEKLFQMPSYNPPICFKEPIEPNSFYVNLQKKI